MAEPVGLPHLLLDGFARNKPYNARPGRGGAVQTRDPWSHGGKLRGDLARALAEADQGRTETEDGLDEQLRALGTVLALEGASEGFPIELNSLDSWSTHAQRRPKWMLLSVLAASDGRSERTQVWIADEYRAAFLRKFEEYQSKTLASGKPSNNALVANISKIRRALLRDLWQSREAPPESGLHWWELWLRRTDDGVALLGNYATGLQATLAPRVLELSDRTVAWVYTDWRSLQSLPFTSVPLAEVRRPEFADSTVQLSRSDQADLVEDLADRIVAASSSAPAVCHLDTGVLRAHALLAASLSPDDCQSVVGDLTHDVNGHGTQMAGLSLFGDLEPLLLGTGSLQLRHRLESVKILPDAGQSPHDPLAYGVVTAAAVALPEATVARPRVFCLPVTASAEGGLGEPTLWSASLDALAAGVGVSRDGNALQLLGEPDPLASRLFLVSAGNTDPLPVTSEYLAECDLAAAQDPAQAWNALTVGAYTEKVGVPTDPSFAGWQALASGGELSPHSRTSGLFGKAWPNKPDFCMEGGNVLVDQRAFPDDRHPLVCLATTDVGADNRLTSANATSAATAQAARLAAMAMAAYPSYWPETIRALLVHGATWTPAMRRRLDGASSKTAKRTLLRRYGWGVPTEESVLSSRTQAVTMVIQDEFVPFEGRDHQARTFRLHELPWPTDVLQGLGSASISLRVTLSYFVEPTAGRRGWRRRFSYSSHGLRFQLQRPLETTDDFVQRIGRESHDEESGLATSSSAADRWLLGPQQRNVGSLHQDLWEGGTGPELARCGVLAVHPVGGWWKSNRRADRTNRPVRYSLVVSLSTPEQGVDLYTPIANELRIPVTGT